MGDDLFRVESAVSASSSGNLTWGNWSIDAITALGLAGRKNPLGFAIVRYMSDQNTAAVWGLVLALAKVIVDRGLMVGDAREVAFSAFELWNNTACPKCGGRGTSQQGTQCPACNGSGTRPPPNTSKLVADSIALIKEAERWMENQLAARLRGQRYESRREGCRVNLPSEIGNMVGTGGADLSPRRDPHD